MKEHSDGKSSECNEYDHKHHHHHHSHGGNAVYGLGFIGAAIFFIGQVSTFGDGVIGFLKAIIWPIYFVYEALKFLIK